MVIHINDLIGVPFRDGGRNISTGLDCWGLVMEVYARLGIKVPDYGKTIPSAYSSLEIGKKAKDAGATGEWEKVDCPAFGDLVAMHTDMSVPGIVNHFGVYINDGRFLHTVKNRNVHIAKTSAIEWGHRIVGYYRWQK